MNMPRIPLSDANARSKPSRSDGTTAHVERILTNADADSLAASDDDMVASWRRSANTHCIDPASREAPRILTTNELTALREPLAKLLVQAQSELDRLFSVVRHTHYVVLLCDRYGVAIEHRGEETLGDQFKFWGPWLGGVWSEEVEGTNGIGTCIAEKRPITVHLSQHFRARHITLSCSGAPIFDCDGEVAAVLDVTSIDPQLSGRSHAITGALTEVSARVIEERWFRDRFRQEWIAAIVPPDSAGSPVLFAIDQDYRVVGADRHARTLLELKKHRVQDGPCLWSVFARDYSLFRHRDREDTFGPLVLAGTSEKWSAVVTPPDPNTGTWRNPGVVGYHTRPRLTGFETFCAQAVAQQPSGGLPPRALRRVKDYIDGNLGTNIDLAALADIAGFSMFHFARAFKHSEGVNPHRYLLDRRIERAEALLVKTDLPISEIAITSGFWDQSHLARHFRQRVGMSPSIYRWSRR
jgi:AraC-like DNA-binding protein